MYKVKKPSVNNFCRPLFSNLYTILFSMTADQFESARLYAVLAVVAFRLAVMPRYLQSYLNIAYYRSVKQD